MALWALEIMRNHARQAPLLHNAARIPILEILK